ncbi:MAG: alpha-L-fucosidase [Acidobacteriota bacterium]|nr:alpha-L-fucosidase [Acidobacteriota bacterium]
MPTRHETELNRRDLLKLTSLGAAAAALTSSPAASSAQVEIAEEQTPPVSSWRRQIPFLQTPPEGLRWFNEAKFGMFIHWGPCSLASVEISWPIMVPSPKWNITQEEYVNLYKRFNPVKYDPDEWIDLAEAAGQRYLVPVTKHHDGFCMFDSSYTDYKITNAPYKKDIIGMLAKACHRRNMALGYYYSPPDMHNPNYRDTSKLAKENWHGEPQRPEWPIYLHYMALQVRELIWHYGQPVEIFFDGLDHQEKYDGYSFLQMIRSMSPNTMVDNRLGIPADYDTPEQWVPKRIPVKGVTIRGPNSEEEQNLPTATPALENFRPWETCMTINGTWAYNKNDHNYKTTQRLIRTLIDVASRGGNFLLNIGPTPEGTIQPEFQQRLRGVGDWLRINGEAIYGTTYGPLQNLAYGRCTAKGRKVYLHIFDWPQSGSLEVAGLARILRVTLLVDGRPLKFNQTPHLAAIELPAQPPDPNASVIVLEL